MFQVILFDLDDTLLDRDASLDPFLREQYRQYKLDPLPFETYRARFRQLDQRGYADRYEVFQTLISEFALPVSIEEAVADFRKNAWKDAQLFAGTLDVLHQLRARGNRLGMITNGSLDVQQTKLIRSGLSSLMDVILIAEQEQVEKPDPQIFIRAAKQLGVRVAECVFVGDNPKTDVAGACRVGMITIWLKRFLPWPDSLSIIPAQTISDLRELLIIPL